MPYLRRVLINSSRYGEGCFLRAVARGYGSFLRSFAHLLQPLGCAMNHGLSCSSRRPESFPLAWHIIR